MMEDIVTLVEQNILLVFIFGFFIFYIAYIKQDFTKLFFIVCIMIVGFLILYEQGKKKNKTSGSIQSFITNTETDLKYFQINYHKVFQVHKAPAKLKFIRKNANLSQLLFELRFMKLYDYGSFLTLIIYLEYFLKYHYEILIGKKSYDHFVSVMKDLRREILNISKAFIFSIPPRSSTLKHIKDLDEFMYKWHDSLVSLTNKYMVVLHNKYLKSSHHLSKSPYEYDGHDTSYNYEMY